ncbi:Ask10p [Saccharomyces eubayanus]|uniref:Ask10p n=1 Tax=Saccharomyces eubayanus TaxID=1080349 RepID=UPI0006C55267|nr:ASK10-like protein [Saccharomyces eubayanus]KOG99590.1 ASK10-like protein [Saccharomyces eubayanus]
MSDYFSSRPLQTLTPMDNRPSGGGGGDDASSIHSKSSQYLMDILPDSMTLNESVSSTVANNQAKEFILPESDERSPYHINVPIPKAQSASTETKKPLSGDADTVDGQFVKEYPTDILVDRFYKWKKILKGLIIYLREVAYAQEQFARINYQLKGSVKFPFLTDIDETTNTITDPFTAAPRTSKKSQPSQKKTVLTENEQFQMQMQQEQRDYPSQPSVDESTMSLAPHEYKPVQAAELNNTSAASGFVKFGSGSIQDVQVILKKYHLSLANQQFKISKEITSTVIPKLEELRKDLRYKITEIKDIHGDFKTNIDAHVQLTSQLLKKYIASVKFMNANGIGNDKVTATNKKPHKLDPKHDPYLLKLQLDLQLKRQVAEETYLQEAFINLQTSGLQLEKIIYTKIQQSLLRYSALIDSEARLMIKNMCQELQHGIISKPPAFEWDNFVTQHPSCLLNWKSNDPIPPPRKLSDVVYPHMKSPLAKCIRAGYFLKKSEVLPTYHQGYFVLTSNYIHEFQSSDFYNLSSTSSTSTKSSTYSSSASIADTYAGATGNTKVNTHHRHSSDVHSNNAANAGTTGVAGTRCIRKKSYLAPIMSVPLNDCTLKDASSTKFVLVGKPTLNENADIRKSSSSTHVSGASQTSLPKYGHETAKIFSKAPFHKFLKGGKPKNKNTKSSELDQFYAAAQKESNKYVTWTFKIVSPEPTEEDLKHFKRWVQDLKNLTSFNDTKERIKFIEDRVMKSHRFKAGYMSKNNMNNVFHTPCLTDSSFALQDATTSSLNPNGRSGKPQYIHIQNNSLADFDVNDFRSRVNTPAIDDYGNLITVERRSAPSPHQSPDYAATSGNTTPSYSSGSRPQSVYNGYNPAVSITSNGMMLQQSAMNSNNKPAASLRHQRNVSQTSSLPGFSYTSPSLPVNSPGSSNSESSSGGYFAIPLHGNNNNNNYMQRNSEDSSPSYNEDHIRQQQPMQSLSRTSSSSIIATGMRSTSAGNPPTTNVAIVPKVMVNNQNVKTVPADQSATAPSSPTLNSSSTTTNRESPYQTLKKTNSTGNVPSLSTEKTHAHPAFYKRGNNSAQNLTTTGTTASRVHPVRKHKKNVSFSSLNSLMFSKKGANYGGNLMTNQFMSGGIQEDDGDSGNNDSIKLNQSIYS